MRVHLHGPFSAFHEGPIEIAANTAWDAVEAVVTQLAGFQPDPITGRKKIQVAGFGTVELLKQPTDVQDIHIMPAMTFGKKGGLVQTIIGVTLIVASIVLPPLGTIAGMSINAAIFMTGASLTIGGVMQMISPQPQLTGGASEEQIRSKYLPSSQNTVKIGTTIALLYGRYRVGGHILSLNIDAKDVGL